MSSDLQTSHPVFPHCWKGSSLPSDDILLLESARQSDVVISVDGAIHRAAGPLLLAENRTHGGCQDGEAVESGGYSLPAKRNLASCLYLINLLLIVRRHLHGGPERRTPGGPTPRLQQLPEEND